MKIQNVDVSKELARKTLDCVPFILDVIRVCEPCQVDMETPLEKKEKEELLKGLPYESLLKINTHSYDDVANMIHQIPIYLKANKSEGEGTIDPLGAYFPSSNGNSPYIEIYPIEIQKATKDDKEYQWLVTKVLLHETMHAIMDVKNQKGDSDCQEKLKYAGGYVKWREESYANGGALWIIRKYAETVNTRDAKDFVQYVEHFMVMNQKDGYSYGVVVAGFPIRYMRNWINEKKTEDKTKEEYDRWCESLSSKVKSMLKILKITIMSNNQKKQNGSSFNLNDYDNQNENDQYIRARRVNIDNDDNLLMHYSILVTKLLQEKISTEECVKLKDYIRKYGACKKVETKAELLEVIQSVISLNEEICNLNWIDVSNIQDFRGLFLHSSFNGDISGWNMDSAEDCSYMFAFSEYDGTIGGLPAALRQPNADIDTTGIFCGSKLDKNN